MITAGIDAGTQSIKVIVYDSEKKATLATSSSPLNLISGEGGLREQEALWWIAALKACFNAIEPGLRGAIEAVSVSGQQHGFVPLADDGSVLTSVKLWCDTSTSEECAEIEEKCPSLASRLGNPVMPGYTASKILYLKKNSPELYKRMKYVMLPHDYLNYYLTDVVTMERGDASGTALMNIFTGEWDEEAARAIDPSLLSKLPAIEKEAKIIGHLSAKASKELGLKRDVIVASGGGDNMMSAIGTGAVSDGRLTISLGTSGTLFASSSRPVYDGSHRLASFCSSHGTWLPLLCTMNCTVASETVRSLFSLDVKEFDKKAALAKRGSDGVYLLPFFNGERIPNLPHGSGAFIGLRPDNSTNENLARATLEGVSYEFLLGLNAFRELGVDVKEITATGGGSKSPFWRSLLADMTGLPIKVLKNGEAAAFGAALQALALAENTPIEKVVNEHVRFDEEKNTYPDSKAHEEYSELYKTWTSYVEALTPLFG